MGRWYAEGLKGALNGDHDFDGSTYKFALLDNGYTPSQAHNAWDDVSADEVPATGGYTAGGQTVTTKAITITEVGSVTAWQASTAYELGDLVRDGSSLLIRRCVVAGTSGTTEPTWATVDGRETTGDNEVTWENVGIAIVVLDFDNPSWTSSTITARYGVLYRDTGTPATSYLLGYEDFGADKSSDNGTFEVAIDADGFLRHLISSVNV